MQTTIRIIRRWNEAKRPGRAALRRAVVYEGDRRLGVVALTDFKPGLLAVDAGAKQSQKVRSLREGVAWLRMRAAWLEQQAAFEATGGAA